MVYNRIMRKFDCLFIIFFLLPVPLFAQTIDLIWQGEGYAPPFYQGRTLWSRQGAITLVAIPHGLGNPATLNYKWTRSGTVLGNLNGVGVNSLSYMDSVLSRTQVITVEIISDQEELLASASVTIAPTSPLLTIYENSPLYGFLVHKEVPGTYEFKEKEVTFTAFPLFFSAPNRDSSALSYSWRANNSPAGTGHSATYRVPDDASGTSAVSIRTSHTKNLIQEAEKGFLVQFGEQNE